MRLQCECGATLDVPAHMTGRRLHCRKCRAAIPPAHVDNLLEAWRLLGDMADDEVPLERECVARDLPLTEDPAKALPILMKLLADPVDSVADRAAKSLEAFPRKSVVESLTAALKTAKGPGVGNILLALVPLLPDLAAGESLTRVFDEFEPVRAAAIRVIGLTDSRDAADTLKRAPEFDSPFVSLAAAQTLWAFDNHVAAHRIKQFIKHHDPDVRARAAYTVAAIASSDLLPLLKRSARDSEPSVRAAAAISLGSTYEAFPHTLNLLKRLAHDDEPLVRTAAARSLAAGDSAKSLRLLLDLARKDGDHHVRRAAVEFLADVDHEAAAPFLHAALDDDDPGVRSIALLHAARHHEPSLTDTLATLLRIDDPLVLRNALLARDLLGADALRDELIRNASNTDPLPRAAAAALLARKTEIRSA